MENTIKGIIILEKIPIKDLTSTACNVAAIGIFIMIMSLVILIIHCTDIDDIMINKIIIGVSLGAVIAFSSLIPIPMFYAETGKYTYKCKLDDSVSANYISEHFKIIDVDGNGVWIIEDK